MLLENRWDWNWKWGAALLLSALVHAAIVVGLLGGLLHPDEIVEPPTVTVELVPKEEPPKPEPPKPERPKPERSKPERPKPEPPKPEPPKPEPPKPEPPKPEPPKLEPPKPEPPKPEPPKPPAPRPPPPQPPVAKPQPAPPPLRPWYLPDKPVLETGKLAEKSNPAESDKAIAIGDGAANPIAIGEATVTERDIILGQIVPLWQRPSLKNLPTDGVVQLRVMVLANGRLGDPFDASRPWNPAVAINQYAQMAPSDPRLALLIGLYSAIRLAQPLKLPPELRAKAPFAAVLDFRLQDIR